MSPRFSLDSPAPVIASTPRGEHSADPVRQLPSMPGPPVTRLVRTCPAPSREARLGGRERERGQGGLAQPVRLAEGRDADDVTWTGSGVGRPSCRRAAGPRFGRAPVDHDLAGGAGARPSTSWYALSSRRGSSSRQGGGPSPRSLAAVCRRAARRPRPGSAAATPSTPRTWSTSDASISPRWCRRPPGSVLRLVALRTTTSVPALASANSVPNFAQRVAEDQRAGEEGDAEDHGEARATRRRLAPGA